MTAPIKPPPLDADQLIARYDGTAPRYTSYPTAVQFTTAVGPAEHDAWLARLAPEAPASLYVHIPYCERLCWYCGCNTRAMNRASALTDYVALVGKEMARAASAAPARLRVDRIHLGGGTPNMTSREDLTALFSHMRAAFDIEPSAEISAELDPAVLSEGWIETAADLGMTRASLGVQDLSPHVQEAVNRIEPFETVADAVGRLRAAGVGSINLDLMYGLPRQTAADVLATLSRILSLRPERLALFGYAHVPWAKPHQRLISDADLPGPVERLRQSEAAAALLEAEGYRRIGLDHFALPGDALAQAAAAGRLRRNFQGYTADPAATLLGFGASSISAFAEGFTQNLTAERDWRVAVREGRQPTARGVALSPDDRFRGEIIERLMCALTVDLDAVCAAHGLDPLILTAARRRLAPFAADGLVRLAGPRIEVTERGAPFVRQVCALFDVHLRPTPERHARVV